VPIGAKFINELNGPFFDKFFQEEPALDILLPFSWSVLFFSALAIGVANFIYVFACPTITKNYQDYEAFAKTGRGKVSLTEMLLELWPRFNRYRRGTPSSDVPGNTPLIVMLDAQSDYTNSVRNPRDAEEAELFRDSEPCSPLEMGSTDGIQEWIRNRLNVNVGGYALATPAQTLTLERDTEVLAEAAYFLREFTVFTETRFVSTLSDFHLRPDRIEQYVGSEELNTYTLRDMFQRMRDWTDRFNTQARYACGLLYGAGLIVTLFLLFQNVVYVLTFVIPGEPWVNFPFNFFQEASSLPAAVQTVPTSG